MEVPTAGGNHRARRASEQAVEAASRFLLFAKQRDIADDAVQSRFFSPGSG